MSEDLGPVTTQDVLALAGLIDAAQRGLRVRWATDDGNVLEGTARSIGDERGNFTPPDVDIRGEYLRVTSLGWEHFLPIRDLLRKIALGEFIVDDPR